MEAGPAMLENDVARVGGLENSISNDAADAAKPQRTLHLEVLASAVPPLRSDPKI